MKAKQTITYVCKSDDSKSIEVNNPKLLDPPATVLIENEEYTIRLVTDTTGNLKAGDYYLRHLTMRERLYYGRELVSNAVSKAVAEGELVRPEDERGRARFDSEISRTIMKEGAKHSRIYKDKILVATW